MICGRPKEKTLIDGRKVCNYCPDWAHECLARDLLARPLIERRKRMAEFSETMLVNLKTTMARIHATRKM
jgi:hypothetical protein